MPIYFAYGANMDVADMAKRAPSSKVIGLARLPRHRFFINADGYASIMRDPRAEVRGLLWDLALADLRPLDRFEGLDRGLYIKINQPVITGTGSKRALIYVASNSSPGKPRPGYLESILASAASLGLPESYRKELSGWSAASGNILKAPTSKPPSSGPAMRAEDKWSWDG